MKTAKELLDEIEAIERLRAKGYTRVKCSVCDGRGFVQGHIGFCPFCEGTGYSGWKGPIESF